MQATINKIDENHVIFEFSDKTTTTLPRSLFPDAKEGDIYQIANGQEQVNKKPYKSPNTVTKSESEMTVIIEKAYEQRPVKCDKNNYFCNLNF